MSDDVFRIAAAWQNVPPGDRLMARLGLRSAARHADSRAWADAYLRVADALEAMDAGPAPPADHPPAGDGEE